MLTVDEDEPIMDIDAQGVRRGLCFACGECEQFMAREHSIRCEYCDCAPAHHRRVEMSRDPLEGRRRGSLALLEQASLDYFREACSLIHTIAQVYKDLGQRARALQILLVVYHKQKIVFGVGHSDLDQTMLLIDEATSELETIFNQSNDENSFTEKLFGSGHDSELRPHSSSDVFSLLKGMAALYADRGEFIKSIQLLTIIYQRQKSMMSEQEVDLDATLALIDGTERNFERSFDVISNDDLSENSSNDSNSSQENGLLALTCNQNSYHEGSIEEQPPRVEEEETSNDTLNEYCII